MATNSCWLVALVSSAYRVRLALVRTSSPPSLSFAHPPTLGGTVYWQPVHTEAPLPTPGGGEHPFQKGSDLRGRQAASGGELAAGAVVQGVVDEQVALHAEELRAAAAAQHHVTPHCRVARRNRFLQWCAAREARRLCRRVRALCASTPIPFVRSVASWFPGRGVTRGSTRVTPYLGSATMRETERSIGFVSPTKHSGRALHSRSVWHYTHHPEHPRPSRVHQKSVTTTHLGRWAPGTGDGRSARGAATTRV